MHPAVYSDTPSRLFILLGHNRSIHPMLNLQGNPKADGHRPQPRELKLVHEDHSHKQRNARRQREARQAFPVKFHRTSCGVRVLARSAASTRTWDQHEPGRKPSSKPTAPDERAMCRH